jgi:hypothetical protein
MLADETAFMTGTTLQNGDADLRLELVDDRG